MYGNLEQTQYGRPLSRVLQLSVNKSRETPQDVQPKTITNRKCTELGPRRKLKKFTNVSWAFLRVFFYQSKTTNIMK